MWPSWAGRRTVHPRACVSQVHFCSQVTLAVDLSHNRVSVLWQTWVVHLCCGQLVLHALQAGTCAIRLTHQSFFFLSCEIRRWSTKGPTAETLTLQGTVDCQSPSGTSASSREDVSARWGPLDTDSTAPWVLVDTFGSNGLPWVIESLLFFGPLDALHHDCSAPLGSGLSGHWPPQRRSWLWPLHAANLFWKVQFFPMDKQVFLFSHLLFLVSDPIFICTIWSWLSVFFTLLLSFMELSIYQVKGRALESSRHFSSCLCLCLCLTRCVALDTLFSRWYTVIAHSHEPIKLWWLNEVRSVQDLAFDFQVKCGLTSPYHTFLKVHSSLVFFKKN